MFISASHFSFDSMDGSPGRENCSPHNDFHSIAKSHIARQDSTDSNSQDSTRLGSYSSNGSPWSHHSSSNSKVSIAKSHLWSQRDDINWASRTVASSPLGISASSKDLEAAEVTIEELRAETSMWEQNAQKLMTDQERLKKELLNQSERQKNLEMELSESHLECDHLKQENNQLNVLLEDMAGKQSTTDNLKFQGKEIDSLLKEMESELRFHKESNADLDLQLKKTQESNIELVSILQELEDTIERQKMEIVILSNKNSTEDTENDGQGIKNDKDAKQNEEVFTNNLTGASYDLNMERTLVEHQSEDLSACFEPETKQLQESQNDSDYRITFLEKSLQDKINELEFERSLNTQILTKLETEWREKLAAKEEEIIALETKLSASLNALASGGSEACNPIKEIGALKQKIEELERDCNELTDENLQLLVKLKESSHLPSCNSSGSSSSENLQIGSLFTAESEVNKSKSQICRFEEDLSQKKVPIEEKSTDHLQMKCINLEKKCADLELQLQASKDKGSCLDSELCKYIARAKQLDLEIAALQQVQFYQGEETVADNQHAGTCSGRNFSESHAAVEMAKLLSKLHELIQLCIVNVKMQQDSACLPTAAENKYSFGKSQISNDADFLGHKEQAEAILNNILQLKDLLEVKINACNGELKQSANIRARATNTETCHKKQEDCNLKEKPLSTSYPESENQQTKSKLEVACFGEELVENIYETDELRSNTFFQKQEVEVLGYFQSLDHQLSSNNNLVRKSSELENSGKEVEDHLSELEKENVQLAERICGLEAQLRYLTDAKESNRLELENSESCVANFKEDITRLESELEAQKVDMKYKLQDMQKRWLEAQEECEYVKVKNVKLQTTAESLIEECSLLQKSNIEFKNRNVELFEHSTILEAELKESEKIFSDTVREFEALEGKYTTMLEEIASKERALNIELETLIHENKLLKEKIVVEESLLNEIYLEKMVEVENLQRQVAHLTEQISGTHDEETTTTSDAVLEISRLRTEKTLLEASLNEVQEKLHGSEININTIRMESETKLQLLGDELVASKQNQEVLMADNEKLLELLKDVKSNEEKHKGIIRGLELKHKASEYQRLQLTDEISNLKVQLEKTVVLQDEILALKRSVSEVNFENQRLEASLQILSADYETQKVEKIQLEQKLPDLQKALSELEECKRSKIALEEKVLRLEGDLTAREALGAADAELKNELARAKRATSELQRKIRHLEEEKQEHLKRAQAFAEGVNQGNEEKQDQDTASVSSFSVCLETNVTSPFSGESNLSHVSISYFFISFFIEDN